MVKNKKPNKKAQMKDTNINTAVRDALRPLEAFNNLLKALNEFIDIQAEIKAKEMLKKKPKKSIAIKKGETNGK